MGESIIIWGCSSIMRYVAGVVGVCQNMILYYTGVGEGKPKYDFILCDVVGGGMGGMIWAELVFYQADPATHPSRIRNKTK